MKELQQVMDYVKELFGFDENPSPKTNEIQYKIPIEYLINYKPSSKISNMSFRPKNFWEYIGQEKIKERLYYYIEGTKSRNLVFPHVLVVGESGMGKSSLIRIIANELKVPFVEGIASNFKEVNEIYQRILSVNGGILFIDETHAIPRDLVEKMYPIMEDFRHEGIDIKPFTLAGATTELGEIIRDRKPFYDRFKIILELENYTIKDLMQIAVQYKDRMFKKDDLPKETYETLARNCRNTPRALIRLLESSIYFNGDIPKVLNNFGIIKDGFTYKDLKIMQYINSNESGVGLQSISNYLGTSPQNFSYNLEPFLLKNDVIVRTGRGRKLTPYGKELLTQLQKNV